MKSLYALILGAFIIFNCQFAHADFDEGKNAILVNFGFSAGGMALGADYEYGYHRTFGIGGYLRMYPDDSNNGAPGITTLGAFVRPHFNRQAWDFYLSPGFGFMSYEPAIAGKSDETLIGPSLAIGLLYEFNANISFGIEQMSLYSWFGEDRYRGFRSQELTAKFRFIF